MSELPENWAQVPLAAITSDVSQCVPADDETIHYIDIGSVNRTTKRIETPQKLLGKDAPSRARKQVAAGDTLVSMTRPNLNAVALVPKELDGEIASTGFDVLRPVAGIDPRWINYLVRTEGFVDSMSALVQGALYPAVRSKDVRAHVVPLAPAAEQARIANQLDTLLTRIQSCNDRFDAIPALLTRFRQTVLEAAVTGALTKDWRSNADFEVKEVALRNLGAISGGLTKNSKRDLLPLRKPYLRVANVHADNLRLGDVTEIGLTPAEYEKTRLQFRDLLIVEGNGSLDHIGRVAMWRGELAECCHQNHLIRWRAGPEAHANYVLLWLLSPTGRTQILNAASSSTGLHTLSVSKVGSLTLRMPSAEEQAEIVRRVEALFAVADRIEARANAARAQAQRLSPLVLAKAFRGELVQQDPQDEPASVLLQRLAATQPAKAKTSRGRPRAKTQELFATPEGVQPDVAGLPDGVWAAPDVVDEHVVTAMLVAALKTWGGPVPQMQARLAAVLCLQPRQMTAVLPAEQAAQWQRLVGPAADPLPAQVARLQPATDSAWRKALLGMRARGDLLEEGSGLQATWALGPGAGQIETAGWPQGRAGWVVAYMRAQGAEAILPLLEPLTVEFVHARAA